SPTGRVPVRPLSVPPGRRSPVMRPLNSQARSRLANDLDRGASLPASWYTDPATLALEYDRIFRRTWRYLGRADQLAPRGDYVTGEPVGKERAAGRPLSAAGPSGPVGGRLSRSRGVGRSPGPGPRSLPRPAGRPSPNFPAPVQL